MTTTDIARRLHAWGGVFLSLFLLLISLTGSVLVWKKEYLWLTIPQSRVDFEITPDLATRVSQRAIKIFGADKILEIEFGHENLALHKVFLPDGYYAYLDNRGNVLAHWQLNERPEEWLSDLHHRLLQGDTGLMVVGLAGLVMLVLSLMGLVAWWPHRKRFRWRLWAGAANSGQLLVSHRNIGIVCLLPGLILLLTGVVLAFPERTQQILLEPVRDTEAYSDLYAIGLDQLTGPEHGTWQAAFSRAQNSFPGAIIRSVQPPSRYSGYRLIGLQQEGSWYQDGHRVYIDVATGSMDMRLNAEQLPTVEKIYNNAYPLHTAKTSSFSYRLVVFLAGIGLSVLSGLGLVSFVAGLRRQH